VTAEDRAVSLVAHMELPVHIQASRNLRLAVKGSPLYSKVNVRQVYIETLENRMARMETMIKTLVPGYTNGKSNGDIILSRTMMDTSTDGSELDPAEQVNGLAEDLGSLLVDHAGDTQYLGLHY
jgi:hypothetical protein